MEVPFDAQKWHEALGHPDWYIRLGDDFKRLEALAKDNPDAKTKEPAYTAVEAALHEGQLPLGDSGEDFDEDRRPIDTIVVHHTKNKPGMPLARLNAMHLLRLYGPEYARESRPYHGQPVWSGHFYQDKQVFWGYHWLVRQDGAAEHILDDRYIGWHAGNWDVNTRSVAFCIDDDLTEKEPSHLALQAIAAAIRKNYPQVKQKNIIGHCDVVDTVCPGKLFKPSWRGKLLALLEA